MSVDPEITIKELEEKNEMPLTEKEKELIKSMADIMNVIWHSPNENNKGE